MRLTLPGLTAIALLIAGCSKPEGPPPPSADELHIKNIGILFQRATGNNRGKSPKDEASFKKVLESIDDEIAQDMKIDPKKPDAIFTSPRDGKPYILRFKGPGVLAYEQVGKGGKRLVVHTTMQVEDVDEAKLKELVPEAK
jgi:hypothetical protein